METLPNNFTVGDDGNVVVPAELFGLKAGDKVAAIQTDTGLILAPRVELVEMLLDSIGSDLKAKGITLEQILQDSQQIREEIYQEEYAPKDTQD